MTPIHVATFFALPESITDPDNRAVSNDAFYRGQMGRQSSTADLLHVITMLLAWLLQIIEQQSDLAMWHPLIEIVAEIGTCCLCNPLQFLHHCKGHRIVEQDPECHPSILRASRGRMTQLTALRTTRQ